MKFQDMPYARPDLAALRETGKQVSIELRKAESFEQAEQALLGWNTCMSGVATMDSLAYIRHTLDTNDPFYDQEIAFWDEASPEIKEIAQQVTDALLETPWRAQLAEQYGELLFLNAEIEKKSFSPAIIPLLQEENKLTTAYKKLLASAQIPFMEGVHTLPQMLPFKQSADDAVRRAAWEAEAGFYKQHGEELDDLFDQLTHLRDEMAKTMGYPDYRTLGYYQMQRNSYTEGDVDAFRKAVREHIVPLADKIYRAQAERTGTPYPLTFADAALTFRTGNAMPRGTAEDILENGRQMYRELSPETAEFIDFLYENQLLDVLSRKGKSGGGYCTSIPDHKAPFIFANFSGTSDDVETMTHEAGHAFAAYVARELIPLENQQPTLESCEIHSMSMEFFAWPWAKLFFGDQAAKFRYGHLAGALTFIPYGTMVDHFQHIVYEKPELTPEERHQAWRELLGMYMPWLKLDGSTFYGEGKGWQRQSHIYERPFYYIDYCLAQTVALQFWALMQRDRDEAWARYMRLVEKAGTQTFDQLVATAGLSSPFGEEALREVADTAAAWLHERSAEAKKY